MAAIKEINLVCMSGQGSVQAVGLLARCYFRQHGLSVASQVFPGPRAKSAPVVSFLRVGDQLGGALKTNQNPAEVLVFWDGLLRIAAGGDHPVVADAIGRLHSGLLLVNTPLAPAELPIPFAFAGTVATVDAEAIAREHLRRDPPPIGTALLGAYVAVTGSFDLALLEELVQAQFPGAAGRQNVAAVRAAHATVRVQQGIRGQSDRVIRWPDPEDPAALPEWYPMKKTHMVGISAGGAGVWRSKIPVCDDSRCQCRDMCLSEVLCPDNTGFIVRRGVPHQGYRIDTEFCRGCGICADVCVFKALKMVPERTALQEHPGYQGISVAPHFRAPTNAEATVATPAPAGKGGKVHGR